MEVPARLDLRRWSVAAGVVFLVRIVCGIVAYLASLAEPALEIANCTKVLQSHHSLLPLGVQRVVLDPWISWDSCHFFVIASEGYDWSAGTVAFHPLYPLLVRATSLLMGGDIALAMLVLGTLIPAAVCVSMARYFSEVRDDALLGNWVGWAAILMPISIVLFMFMTEGLFILLAVGCLWALHRQNWLAAGALGALATLTRQQGIVLMLPIFWELWKVRRTGQLRFYDWLACVLPGVGYLGFSIYRLFVLSEAAPSAGIAATLKNLVVSEQANQIVLGQRFGWPWESTWLQIWHAFDNPELFIQFLFDPIVGWIFVGLLAYGARYMTPAERLFSLGIVIASLCYVNGNIEPCLALPRHILIAFPIFMVFAMLIQRASNPRAFVAISLLINLALLIMFVNMRWIP